MPAPVDTAAARLVFGYATRGRRVHAVDLNATTNRLAVKQGWTDVVTGAPYRVSLCRAVVMDSLDEWHEVEGLACQRCAGKVAR